MSRVPGVDQEIIEKFSSLSQEAQKQMLQNWAMRAYTWMNKARILVNQAEKEIVSKRSQRSIKKIQSIFKNKSINTSQINIEKILIDGYILLNEIGERIRGEQILYSITITKTGESLSSGTGGVFTWTVPLKEFIPLLNFSASSGIYLKSSTTLYKMLENQIQNKKNNPQYEEWDDEKINDYQTFFHQVKTNRNWPQWHKINEGNVLEGFLRFLDDNNKPEMPSFEKQYWERVGSAMKRTMKHPDPFFKGGDINSLQVKGLRASVTNLNTLIQNIQKVLLILNSSQAGRQVLEKYYRSVAEPSVDKEIQLTQQEVIDKLVAFFTSNVTR